MRKWIVVVEEDAVAIVEAASEEEAIKRWREQEGIGPDLTPDELLWAIPADHARLDVVVPGRLIYAIEEGEEPDGEEAEDVAILLDRLGDDVPLDWLRVGDESDMWVPIVK